MTTPVYSQPPSIPPRYDNGGANRDLPVQNREDSRTVEMLRAKAPANGVTASENKSDENESWETSVFPQSGLKTDEETRQKDYNNLVAADYASAKPEYKPTPGDIEGVVHFESNIIGVRTTNGERLIIDAKTNLDAYTAAATKGIMLDNEKFGADYQSDDLVRDRFVLAGYTQPPKGTSPEVYGVRTEPRQEGYSKLLNVHGVHGAYVDGDWAVLTVYPQPTTVNAPAETDILVNKKDHPDLYRAAQDFYISRMEEIEDAE